MTSRLIEEHSLGTLPHVYSIARLTGRQLSRMSLSTSLRRRLIRSSLVATLVGAAIFASCANGATNVGPVPEDPGVIQAPATIALTDVTVVPMTTAQRLENQAVIITDGRILADATVDRSGGSGPCRFVAHWAGTR